MVGPLLLLIILSVIIFFTLKFKSLRKEYKKQLKKWRR
jgi:hypothetical protein